MPHLHLQPMCCAHEPFGLIADPHLLFMLVSEGDSPCVLPLLIVPLSPTPSAVVARGPHPRSGDAIAVVRTKEAECLCVGTNAIARGFQGRRHVASSAGATCPKWYTRCFQSSSRLPTSRGSYTRFQSHHVSRLFMVPTFLPPSQIHSAQIRHPHNTTDVHPHSQHIVCISHPLSGSLLSSAFGHKGEPLHMNIRHLKYIL